MDIVIERGGLRDASASDFRHKSVLTKVTYAHPHAGADLRAGMLTKMGQLLPLLRSENATTMPVLDM